MSSKNVKDNGDKTKTTETMTFDVKKEYKYLYSPKARKPEIVDVPAFKYIMVDGKGDPGTAPDYTEKIQLLYGLAYSIRFLLKKTESFVFKVPALAGLWTAEDMNAFIESGRRDEWQWTLMILMPDRVTEDAFETGKAELIKKKNPPLIDLARFDIYNEGKCAQIMHIGPYSEEGPTIEMLHSYFRDQGYTFNGLHHEIYLSDPRKTAPEKLKTIIRQPIKKI